MKRERRHELQTNELADWLGKKYQAIQPYQNMILGGVLLVVVAAAVYFWWANQASAKRAEAWDAFYTGLTKLSASPTDLEGVVSDLDAVIRQNPDTHVANWAAVVAGDLRLASGSNQLLVDRFELARLYPEPKDQLARWAAIRARANQDLRQAVDYYLSVQKNSSQPMLRERATFGLARAREAQGKLDEAIQTYEKLVQQWPDGVYAEEAARRAEDLKRPWTRKVYDRFANFEPRESKTDFGEEPGEPGKRFDFDEDLLSPDPILGPDPLKGLELKGTDLPKPESDLETLFEGTEPDATAPKPEPAESAEPDSGPPESSEGGATESEPDAAPPEDAEPDQGAAESASEADAPENAAPEADAPADAAAKTGADEAQP